MTASEDLAAKRDRELERSGRRPIVGKFSTSVVGVSFVDGYPDNLLRIDATMRSVSVEPEVKLVRNPANKYDPNAIEVHVDGIGMVGHLTRPIAARLAPALDAGDTFYAHVEAVLIDPDHPDRPGLLIECVQGRP